MTANAEQAQAWNGAEGQFFVAEQARHERMMEPHTDRLLAAAGIEPGDAVLDIGCGCGQTTIRAARCAPPGYALGVDLSAVMLAEARRLAEREGVGNARFEQADAQTTPFPVAGFDVALSRFGLMFFDDPAAAFANLAAAVRPGGRLAFVCWQDPLSVEYYRVPIMAIAPHVSFPAPPDEDQPGPFSLARPERIRTLLAGAGLAAVQIEDLPVQAWIGRDAEDAIGYYRSLPVARALLASAGKQAAGQVIQALRDALQPYQADDGIRLGAAAWLVTATR
jgi:SAM-dependent methyltransferase